MKTFKFLFATLAIVFASTMQAQISVNVNIGTRPAWGPVVAPEVRYYYLPDVEVYYDIPSSMYIFFDGGRWIHRRQLPARYRNYDLHRGRKIVVDDYRGDSPYTHCKYQYKHDNGYDRREHGERDEREAYVVKRHDNERGHWKNEDHDNGRGHGNGKHKGWRD